MDWLLRIIVLLPLLAAAAVGFVPGSQRRVIRGITLGASGLSLLCALIAFCSFEVGSSDLQFETKWIWVKDLRLNFHLAADGINIGIILMGAIVAFAAACCADDITYRVKEFHILLNLMIGGILGAFASMDLFFFYFFH